MSNKPGSHAPQIQKCCSEELEVEGFGKLELEIDQFEKPWFGDQNIEQSSSARRAANDDDYYIAGR